jgi:mono/diheme cytochrome c family protein
VTRSLVFALGLLVLGCNGDDELTGIDAILALTPDTENGALVFDAQCALCHADDGSGVEGLGSDIRAETDQTVVVTSVYDGNDEGMTAFADILTEQDIADVSGFVTSGGLGG